MIKIRVKANNSLNSIFFDSNEDIYIVRTKSPALKNKANTAIIKQLNKHFNKKCKIKSGLTSNIKYIEFLE